LDCGGSTPLSYLECGGSTPLSYLDCGGSTPLSYLECGGSTPLSVSLDSNSADLLRGYINRTKSGVEPPQSKQEAVPDRPASVNN
jgi:hypothetical protein